MREAAVSQRMEGLTTLLDNAAHSPEHGFSLLVDQAYTQLKKVAANRLLRRYGDRAGQMTLQPTVLAHDVLMRLREQQSALQNTDHFFAIAARLMFQIIVDHDRARLALKRGGVERLQRLEVAEMEATGLAASPGTGNAVVDAIASLHSVDPRATEIAVLHVVCGHPLETIAEALDISLSTVKRDWRFARGWLAKQLGELP